MFKCLQLRYSNEVESLERLQECFRLQCAGSHFSSKERKPRLQMTSMKTEPWIKRVVRVPVSPL